MIDPDDLVRFAEQLAQGSTETEWRDAVSRGYYGAFHAGRLLLRGLNFRVPRAATAHAYVWMRLSNCGHADIQHAGGTINNFQRHRNEADYDIHLPYQQSHAQTWARVARDLVQTIAAGHQQPTRSQITAGIRDYERNVLRAVTWQGP